jgi:hypothetical protein
MATSKFDLCIFTHDGDAGNISTGEQFPKDLTSVGFGVALRSDCSNKQRNDVLCFPKKSNRGRVESVV